MISDQIMDLYNALVDEESRFIFVHRLLYMLTDDLREIFKIVKYVGDKKKDEKKIYGNIQKLDEFILKDNSGEETIIIMGMDHTVDLVYEHLVRLKIKVKYFCGIETNNKFHNGLSILSVEHIAKIKNKKIIIASHSKLNRIKSIRQLIRHGISENEIIILRDLEPKYFRLPFLQSSENGVFVDGGALDGKTILEFKEWCGENYKRIYSFEPDKYSFNVVEETIKQHAIRDVVLSNIGLWENKGHLRFEAFGSNGSHINECGNELIMVEKLDDIIKDEKVTYIKFDIEGSELYALKGAKEIIVRDKPALAISVYNRKEEMLDVMFWIHNLMPEYKLYLRHHLSLEYDTVLYACL